MITTTIEVTAINEILQCHNCFPLPFRLRSFISLHPNNNNKDQNDALLLFRTYWNAIGKRK